MVLVSDRGYVNCLLNPSTSEYKQLPSAFKGDPSACFDFYPPGFGYVSYTDDYKVVMPFFIKGLRPNYALMIVDVYSLKADAWTWRTIRDFRYKPVKRRRGVCFNERLHWLCQRNGGLDYSKVIVAFDLEDEIFREVQLSASYDDTKFWGHDMVVLEGCLCLLVWSKGEQIDVWMMMEYGVRESWTKVSIANPEGSMLGLLCLSAQDELVFRKKRLRVIRGRLQYELRLQNEFDGEELILYNLKKGTRREMVVPGIPATSLVWGKLVGDRYIETLVSPNRGGRISEIM